MVIRQKDITLVHLLSRCEKTVGDVSPGLVGIIVIKDPTVPLISLYKIKME
jgi:hypothetical protein